MRIYNNTQNELYYGINASGFDCGTIAAQQTAVLPQANEEENVTVQLSVVSHEFGVVQPFTATIPESQTHMVVTIGLYTE